MREAWISGEKVDDMTQLRAELAQAIRERDLAIAHDRQPYPTVWAYEQACKALAAAKEEIAKLRDVTNQQDRDWVAERAAREKAEQERDKFEAESEQKGADLMAAEGVIAEIIDAHERSASSEIGQLIEDARAARAKEGEKR